MEINALSALSTQTATGGNNNKIADNFDTFLGLLTTQLRNQNPLEPLDTNEFTAQLVQFAGVEQSISTNQNLEQLLALQVASALTGIVDYIGKTVTAEGSTTTLKNGEAVWSLDANSEATAELTIRNSVGQVVQTATINLNQGENNYTWDGRTSSGSTAPDGLYSISVDAKAANGNAVNVSTLVKGMVTGVDITGSEPLLTVGDTQIKLASVTSINQS